MNNYPDFTYQILQLRDSLENTQEEQKQKLLTKWLEQLQIINDEINHLKKIESFASLVKKD